MKINKWIKAGIVIAVIVYLLQWNLMFYFTGMDGRHSSDAQVILFLLVGVPCTLLLNTFLDCLLIISPLGVKLFMSAGQKISNYYRVLALVIYITCSIMTCIFYIQYNGLYKEGVNYSGSVPELNMSSFNTFKEHLDIKNFFTYVFSSSKAFFQYSAGNIKPNKENPTDRIFVTPFMWSIRWIFVNIWLIALVIRRIAINKTKL